MVYLGLYLAHALLDAPLPEGVLRRISKNRTVRSAAQAICDSIFSGSKEAPGVLENCLFYVSIRERLRDKVRLCIRTLSRPVPGQWDQLGLDSVWARCANVMRHLLLGVTYGCALARQRLGNR
jgi:hypothetical protein